MKFAIVERSQHAKRGRSGFSGPDHYMAVLEIPDGAVVPSCLRGDVLAARGIAIHYVGEFYGRHYGPRSLYAKCLRFANTLVIQLSTITAPTLAAELVRTFGPWVGTPSEELLEDGGTIIDHLRTGGNGVAENIVDQLETIPSEVWKSAWDMFDCIIRSA